MLEQILSPSDLWSQSGVFSLLPENRVLHKPDFLEKDTKGEHELFQLDQLASNFVEDGQNTNNKFQRFLEARQVLGSGLTAAEKQ